VGDVGVEVDHNAITKDYTARAVVSDRGLTSAEREQPNKLTRSNDVHNIQAIKPETTIELVVRGRGNRPTAKEVARIM
jgi:hypothetical protein